MTKHMEWWNSLAPELEDYELIPCANHPLGCSVEYKGVTLGGASGYNPFDGAILAAYLHHLKQPTDETSVDITFPSGEIPYEPPCFETKGNVRKVADLPENWPAADTIHSKRDVELVAGPIEIASVDDPWPDPPVYLPDPEALLPPRSQHIKSIRESPSFQNILSTMRLTLDHERSAQMLFIRQELTDIVNILDGGYVDEATTVPELLDKVKMEAESIVADYHKERAVSRYLVASKGSRQYLELRIMAHVAGHGLCGSCQWYLYGCSQYCPEKKTCTYFRLKQLSTSMKIHKRKVKRETAKKYYEKMTKPQMVDFLGSLHRTLDGDNNWNGIPGATELWDKVIEEFNYHKKFLDMDRKFDLLNEAVHNLFHKAGIPSQGDRYSGLLDVNERLQLLADKLNTLVELQGIIVDMVREQRAGK